MLCKLFLLTCMLHCSAHNWNQYGGDAMKSSSAKTTGKNVPQKGAGITPVLVGDVYTGVLPVIDDSGAVYGLTRGAIAWTLNKVVGGKVIWTTEHSEFTNGALSVSGSAVIVEGPQYTFSVNPSTGSLISNFTAAHTQDSVLVGDTLYTYSRGSHSYVQATDVREGTQLWKTAILGPIDTNMVAASNGTLLVMPNATHLLGWNAVKGTTAFVVPLGGGGAAVTSVYVAADSTNIYLAVQLACYTQALNFMGVQQWKTGNYCGPLAIGSQYVWTTNTATSALSSLTVQKGVAKQYNFTVNAGTFKRTFRHPIVVDDGAQQVYFSDKSTHRLTAMSIPTGHSTFQLPLYTLKAKNGGERYELSYPVALKPDGSVICMVYTGRGGGYDAQYETLLVVVDNHPKAPIVDAPLWWVDNKIITCPSPTFEPGFDLGFVYEIQTRQGSGTWQTQYKKIPIFPTVYMRTPTTPCLYTETMKYGNYQVRVVLNSTGAGDDSFVGYSVPQVINLANSTLAKGPQCPQFNNLESPVNGVGTLGPNGNGWSAHMPTVLNTTGYPGDKNVLRWTKKNVTCALNGITPQQPIFGGLIMEVDQQELHYENGYDNVIGRTAQGKARMTIDYNGDGVIDYQHYWPNENGEGQDFYIFSHLYDNVYVLKHDDPVMFNFPPLQQAFTGGTIEIAVWLTAYPAELASIPIVARSGHRGRGPQPYPSGIRFPFASAKPFNSVGCDFVCPNAYYYDSYWGN